MPKRPPAQPPDSLYNRATLLRRLIVSFVVLLSLSLSGSAQTAHRPSRLVLVMPFENSSHVSGIEWIGEAFSEVLGQRLGSEGFSVVSRQDRAYAFERMGIPAYVRPSRATVIRLAQEMD